MECNIFSLFPIFWCLFYLNLVNRNWAFAILQIVHDVIFTAMLVKIYLLAFDRCHQCYFYKFINIVLFSCVLSDLIIGLYFTSTCLLYWVWHIRIPHLVITKSFELAIETRIMKPRMGFHVDICFPIILISPNNIS